ncbi:MAG: hypothetical protein OEO83_13445 [Alphaproteobacteria bacterium]|nr:hypothetical protein [Alphaproteobacteria bacterium]
MTIDTDAPSNAAVTRYLEDLGTGEPLVQLDWEQWLGIGAPYPKVDFTVQEVTARFSRNGYDWDIHGRLYTPAKEVDPTRAFVVCHGGAGSERIMDETPDGRPGVSPSIAAQGFKVLAMTYPGHYPPGGTWQVSVEDRMPVYLLDRELPEEEILDRNLKCTFNVDCQGFATLIDRHLAGRNILAWGHSTSGPMVAMLHRFVEQAEIGGLCGFGTGGPDGWRLQWREQTGSESVKEFDIDAISRRNPTFFKSAGYEDPEDLCPWGGAENYLAWAGKVRSQMKTSLCDNQHLVNMAKLEEYPKRTGLPRQEYFDHIEDPDPAWIKKIQVLLTVGENDKGHWKEGKRIEDKREPFMIRKYRESGAKRAQLVLIPRYGHVGYAELHNEKIAYLWLWAFKNGYFSG